MESQTAMAMRSDGSCRSARTGQVLHGEAPVLYEEAAGLFLKLGS